MFGQNKLTFLVFENKQSRFDWKIGSGIFRQWCRWTFWFVLDLSHKILRNGNNELKIIHGIVKEDKNQILLHIFTYFAHILHIFANIYKTKTKCKRKLLIIIENRYYNNICYRE